MKLAPNQSIPIKSNLLACLLFLSLLLFFPRLAEAKSITLTTTADWASGQNQNLTSEVVAGELQLQADGFFGARSWKTPDTTLGIGSTYTSDGTDIYVIRGLADVEFWKYSTTTDTWTTLANLPKGAYFGAELEYFDNYIYAFMGGYQQIFARYSIEHNNWEVLSDVPGPVYDGATLTNDGISLYALRGNSAVDFYKYDVATNSWSTLAEIPLASQRGADLVHVGDYLYTPRGSATATFYRYDLNNNIWETLPNIPATLGDSNDITTNGIDIFVSRQGNTTSFYAYNIASQTWRTLATLPAAARYGGTIYNQNDGLVYVFQANSQYNFWKYDISSDLFLGPDDAPATLAIGSDFITVGDFMYVTRGNSANLYRYDLSNGSWETLTNAPASFTEDTKGVAVGTDLYFFRGANVTTFWKYSTTGNSWTVLAEAPANVRYGGGLAYPGSGDYIYGTRGSNTYSFWRYSISNNIWDESSVPDLPTDAKSSYGSRMTSDGTDIYYLAGIGVSRWLKYSPSSNSWTELSQVPFAPYYGTDLAYYNGKIIALAGWYKNDLWEYTIGTNSWRKLKPLPGYFAQDIGPYSGASIESDGKGSYYISRGTSRTQILMYTEGTGNYVSTGNWLSGTHDFGYVTSWDSFYASTLTPDDSNILFETRSSSNGNDWSSWTAVSGGNIYSPPSRYLQIRATLVASSGGNKTPILQEISINYTGDTDSPENPTSISGYSQEVGGSPLTDGGTYRYLNPYFSWMGASDVSSEIEGYYVYFGINDQSDPTVAGEYQVKNSYLVTKPLSPGTYYLRIVTRDKAGNTSNPSTLFTYEYSGIAPVQSLLAGETVDFTGDSENINTSNGEIKLNSRQDGFWLEETLSNAPVIMQYAAENAAYVESTNILYFFRGNNSAEFYSYDIDLDAWTRLADAPSTVRYGGGVVEGPSGYLYALKGDNSTSFWRYNITENTWSDPDASDAPQTVQWGSSLVFDGSTYIYVLRGNDDDAFWRYNASSDIWENLVDVDFGAPFHTPHNNVNISGDLAINQKENLVYATQGNYLSGFSVYDISTNKWTALSSLPQLPYYGSSIEYVPEYDRVYYKPGNVTNRMYAYDVASQDWREVKSAPVTFNFGSSLTKAGKYLYALQGNTVGFYKYSFEKDSWMIPNRGLFGKEYLGTNYLTMYTGANIIKGDGDDFYLTRGNVGDEFIRWNSVTGQVSTLKSTPVGMTAGSVIVYDSTEKKIYLTGGVNAQKFYVYDIASNNWVDLDDDPLPIIFDYGSSMVYDGSRYIYATRGGAQRNFYRFDTQGTPGSKWIELAISPAGFGYGAKLLFKDGFIYSLRGQNAANNPFYRYEISSNTWSDPAVADLNISVYNGGSITDGNNGSFYATSGSNSANFYRYSLTDNAWTQLKNAPAKLSYGSDLEGNGDNKIFMISGSGSDSYTDAIYTYILPTDTSAFEEKGTYLSPEYDFNRVYKWSSLDVEYESKPNTSLVIQTRSSDDGVSWSSWTEVASKKQFQEHSLSYQIKSPPARFLQVRFELSSADGIYSGVIGSYTINYFKDTLAPENPKDEGFEGFADDSKTEPVVSDTWNGYDKPYFIWQNAESTYGATDSSTGSGVAGYYVYFGGDANADPELSGVLQVNNSFTTTSLVNGQIYYLRIKTVDDAGNVSGDTWQPFIYKYDNEAPDAPSNLHADPYGFTATNNFHFSWDEVISDGSAVTAYCYKTDAPTGEYATEQCTPTNSVSNVTAHKIGSNKFLVRTKNVAGNFSPYTTVSYYFVDSENAPAPPLNLSVTPTTNTENSFSFAWDPPEVGTYYGSQSNLSYHYSVNAVPTAQSTSKTSLKNLPPGAYATLPGDNTFYIVTQDEAGNINYSNYTSVVFTTNTNAPGIPLNIEIADVSVKSTESWKLALSWEKPKSGEVKDYAIYRSTDGENFTSVGTSGGIAFVDVGLVQQTYYYKVQACDSTKNCGAFSEIVSLLPNGKFTTPADLISGPNVSEITTKKATISWATSRDSESKIAFGLSSGEYFEEEIGNSLQVTDHSLSLPNLSPGTKYYYVTRWTDEDGNIGQSDEGSFTTEPPPSTEEPVAKNIGLDSALIEFKSKNASRVRIYYGTTSAFGSLEDITTGAGENAYTVQLTELLDGTKYYFKINSFDAEGEEYEGETHSFTTMPRPKISNIKVNQVRGTAQSTILLTWDSNTEISSIVTYYPVSNPAGAKDEVNIALKSGRHQMVVSALSPQTTYVLIIKGRDSAGNEAVGELQQVTTAIDTRPPQISELKVDGEILGSGSEATAQLVVSFTTDEPATAQVEFGEGSGATYSQKTQEDGTLTSHHLVVISELNPGKVYHLRAISKDEYGNQAESVDKVVITPNATDSAIDLVISNMLSIFGFLVK